MSEPGASPWNRCPWCDASAPAGATACPACGATLAQRTSIGELVIPGVTNVDPALKAYAAQPLHIPKNSPSQSTAGAAVAAAAVGGPIGLAALGGLAAVAAAEYLGAKRGAPGAPAPAEVGRPSEAVLKALGQLGSEPAGKTPAKGAEGERRSG